MSGPVAYTSPAWIHSTNTRQQIISSIILIIVPWLVAALWKLNGPAHFHQKYSHWDHNCTVMHSYNNQYHHAPWACRNLMVWKLQRASFSPAFEQFDSWTFGGNICVFSKRGLKTLLCLFLLYFSTSWLNEIPQQLIFWHTSELLCQQATEKVQTEPDI